MQKALGDAKLLNNLNKLRKEAVDLNKGNNTAPAPGENDTCACGEVAPKGTLSGQHTAKPSSKSSSKSSEKKSTESSGGPSFK